MIHVVESDCAAYRPYATAARLPKGIWLRSLIAALSLGAASLSIAAGDDGNAGIGSSGGNIDTIAAPIRLGPGSSTAADRTRSNDDERLPGEARRASASRYVPGEFELFVNRQLGMDVSAYTAPPTAASGPDMRPPLLVRRLAADLLIDGAQDATVGPRSVGEDYVLGIGDEVQVTVWGSIDGDLRLIVDRTGRITIPRVGPIMVAGVRYGQLNEVVRSRIAQVFRNFQVATSLGRLRSFRVYVTGFTQRPGAYMVSSLSTLVTGLIQSGGPSAAGSFRQIELRRGGKLLSRLDLYGLLLQGDKSADLPLQAEDVIYIGPLGPQAAVLGSVNKASIVELKAGDTVSDVLDMVGGFSAVADRSRIAVERLSDRNDRRVTQLELPTQAREAVNNGDVLRAFSAVDAALAQARQYKRVRVEGEVLRPGDYLLPPTGTLQDALRSAGGLTPQAYVFGTDFSRESARKVQQENYDRALRDMETDFTRATSTQRATTADEAAAQAQRASGTSRLIERLRSVRPTGRIVLQLPAEGASLPDLVVEDGDRLTIPTRPTSVGVFGSVFNAGSYLFKRGDTLDDVMKLAGGAKKGADLGSVFVVRANGNVVSARQSSSGWLSMGSAVNGLAALPGDTIFVPEELDKTTFIQSAKDWTQILYQFGLGAAALQTIRN